MPHTISGGTIGKIIIASVVPIVFAVVTPFAVMRVIGAIGFEAEGISAGTIAAGMMSAEAIASGGGIITGGTVTTLQSIAAVGFLGAAGAGACVAAGAAVGRLASLGVVLASSGLANGQDRVDYAKHLPLCSWRMWK